MYLMGHKNIILIKKNWKINNPILLSKDWIGEMQ